jgi:hypothetical protein
VHRTNLIDLERVRVPTLNETLILLIGGKTCPAICTDVFDGGHGWYVDAAFPKQTRYRFSVGEQCGIAGLGERCLADFVSYPTGELWKVRFLISKEWLASGDRF